MVATNPEIETQNNNPFLMPYAYPMTLACLGNHDGTDGNIGTFDEIVSTFCTLAEKWDAFVQEKEAELPEKPASREEQIKFLDSLCFTTIDGEENPAYCAEFAKLDAEYAHTTDKVIETIVRIIDEMLCHISFTTGDDEKNARATSALRKTMLVGLLRNIDARHGKFMQEEMLKQLFGGTVPEGFMPEDATPENTED